MDTGEKIRLRIAMRATSLHAHSTRKNLYLRMAMNLLRRIRDNPSWDKETCLVVAGATMVLYIHCYFLGADTVLCNEFEKLHADVCYNLRFPEPEVDVIELNAHREITRAAG